MPSQPAYGPLRQQLLPLLLAEIDLPPAGVSERPEDRARLRVLFDKTLAQQALAVDAETREQVFQMLADDLLGYGPLEALLRDPTIEEIIILGADRVFVLRDGLREQISVRFDDESHASRVIDRLVAPLSIRRPFLEGLEVAAVALYGHPAVVFALPFGVASIVFVERQRKIDWQRLGELMGGTGDRRV